MGGNRQVSSEQAELLLFEFEYSVGIAQILDVDATVRISFMRLSRRDRLHLLSLFRHSRLEAAPV